MMVSGATLTLDIGRRRPSACQEARLTGRHYNARVWLIPVACGATPLALRKLGITVKPASAAREYNAGASQQLAAGIVLDTGRRRVTRKLGFGKQTVAYENHYAGAGP